MRAFEFAAPRRRLRNFGVGGLGALLPPPLAVAAVAVAVAAAVA